MASDIDKDYDKWVKKSSTNPNHIKKKWRVVKHCTITLNSDGEDKDLPLRAGDTLIVEASAIQRWVNEGYLIEIPHVLQRAIQVIELESQES